MNKSFGDRSFAAAAPRVWNSLPDALLLLLLLLKLYIFTLSAVDYFDTFSLRLTCLFSGVYATRYSLGWSPIGFPMKNFVECSCKMFLQTGGFSCQITNSQSINGMKLL